MLPTGNHNDYKGILKRIPRWMTSYLWRPTIKLFGSAPLVEKIYKGKTYMYPKPIPDRGQYWVGLGLWYIPTFALQTKGGIYMRGPTRFDDIEDYHTIPSFAFKRYK